MESTGATSTNASEATDGVQHDAASYYETASDAATNDLDTESATNGYERDADASDAILITSASTTVEDDVTGRGE